ncbi:MAG: TetR family transcriptional regulator C-terminal domain-containing protein, partial [Eubacteriales bacterium]
SSGGCPIGNLAQELSDSNDILRIKLQEALEKTKKNIAVFLEKAKENNEISDELDVDEFADFIFNSWEGSLLRMKVTKSMIPMELFEKMIFETVLNNYRK